jgi:putative membrane protein (TIGR04086 family)
MVIVRSSIIAVVITLICFIIFALVIKLFSLQERIIPAVVQVIRTICIALGGLLAARSSRKRGWLIGTFTGVLYVVWAFIISGLFGSNMNLTTIVFSDILLGIVAGTVGGIIGINLE